MNFQEQQGSPKRVQQQLDMLKDVSKRRLSDYVKLSTGRVASKNALGLGALVGASVLMELFLAGTAHATHCVHSQWEDASFLCHHECSTVQYISGSPYCRYDQDIGCFVDPFHQGPHSCP